MLPSIFSQFSTTVTITSLVKHTYVLLLHKSFDNEAKSISMTAAIHVDGSAASHSIQYDPGMNFIPEDFEAQPEYHQS